MAAHTMPILAQNGRDVIGEAKTAAGAARKLRRMIDVHPLMNLSVWLRPAHIAEINGGPVGWVYAVSYGSAA